MKNLTRSSNDRMLGGVCGGIANYFGYNAALVRIITLLLAALGCGILIYIVAWVVTPTADGSSGVKTIRKFWEETKSNCFPQNPKSHNGFDPYQD